MLGRYIADHSAGRAVIVGGDFNLHSDREVDQAVLAQLLADTGLTDSRSVVDDGDPAADQIDKFLFRSGGGVTLEPLTHEFEASTFVRPTDGAPLSDHDPLLVEFSWSADVVTTSTSPSVPATSAPTTAGDGAGPPRPILARTGSTTGPLALTGIGLLACGAAMVVAGRRRSRWA